MTNAPKPTHTPKSRGVKKQQQRPGEPDWSGKCDVCGESPVVPETGMCGPCTFGEAETIGGEW